MINRTLIEAARTMLADSKLPTTFWAEADNMSVFVQHRVLIIKPHNKTPYELFLGRKLALSFMRPFECHVTILNTIDHLGEEEKNDAEHPENEDNEVPTTEEQATVIKKKDENVKIVYSDDDEGVGTEADMANLDTHIPVSPIPTTIIHKDHPIEQIIGDIHSAPQTRRIKKSVTDHGMFSSVQQMINHKDFHNCLFACFLSQIEPKKVIQALTNPSWIEAMQEELMQFKLQQGYTKKGNRFVEMDVKSAFLKEMCTEFEKIMHKRFYMSSMGELTFFLGLQVTQKNDGIFISQDKYVDEILKKFDFLTVKTASTPMETSKPLLKDENAKDVDSPNGYTGASLDRKSTTGGYQFLGRRIISCQCKKQTIVANSTTEAEYVVASNKTVIKEWEDIMERAATTTSSLEAKQDSVLVYVARHTLTAVRHKLMLPGITYYCWLQALLDKKKIVINESTIRQDLHLEDAEGTNCLPYATIFEELTRMGYEKLSQKLTFYKAFFSPQWKFLIHTILQCLSAKTTTWNEFSSTMASAIICLATNQKFNFSKYIFNNMMKNLEGGVKFPMYPRFVQIFVNQQLGDMSHHKKVYVTPPHTKKSFTNMKREGKGFSGTITPLFATMMVQAPEDMGEDSATPTDSHPTPIITQPSSSKPQKKHSKKKQRKDIGTTKPIPGEATNEEHVSTPSYDPSQSKIATLKERVKKLERKEKGGKELTSLNRLYTGKNDEDLMFDTDILNGDEVLIEPAVTTASTTTAATTVDELTLAHTLIEIKAAKPKAITTAATTVTPVLVRPRAKGIVFHDQKEQAPASRPKVSSSQSQLPQAKDKGKAKIDEPEIPLKKKDQNCT
ncbi:putative ribonuclease H-like domain-containing protein [Tanacetum coccineum]